MPAERRSRLLANGRRSAALVAVLLACTVALAPAQAGLAPAPDPGPAPAEPGGGGFDRSPEQPAEPGPREQPPEPPPRARVDRDVRFLGAHGPALDVHLPAHRRRAPAVLVVHGGAWRGGDKAALSSVARALAQAGFVAVNVNYTLATAWRPGFPTQLDELRAAVRWIRAHAAELRVDPTRIGAFGSSAGAHLASLLATAGRGRLSSGDRVRAVVAWSAPFDLAPSRLRRLRAHVAGFVGCWICPHRRAAASPIAHVTADDPPMMIVNSRREMIHASQARRMAARLRAAGVPHRLWLLPGATHAPRYAPTALWPAIAFLDRKLR